MHTHSLTHSLTHTYIPLCSPSLLSSSSPSFPPPPLSSPPLSSLPQRLGVVQIHEYYSCYSDSQLIWLFMSYIYKVLLQIAAIYFAFMSRKIRVKALNDSKQIAAIIYITSLLLLVSAFGFWIGLVYLNTSAAVFGIAQLLIATVILALLFIPKVGVCVSNTHNCVHVLRINLPHSLPLSSLPSRYLPPSPSLSTFPFSSLLTSLHPTFLFNLFSPSISPDDNVEVRPSRPEHICLGTT